MVRIVSKLALIAAALLLISSQALAQQASSLPVLYRNGVPVNPGSPAGTTEEEVTESDSSVSSTETSSGAISSAEESEPIIVPPIAGPTEPEPEATTQEPESILQTPSTDGGLVALAMNLGLMVVFAGAGAFTFLYFKRKRTPVSVDDAIPLPVSPVADSPSRLREALAEMQGNDDQSKSA